MPRQPMNFLLGGLHHGSMYEGEPERRSEKVVMLRPPGEVLSLRFRETYAVRRMSDGIRQWRLVGLCERSPQLEVVDALMHGAASMISAETDDHGHVLKARYTGGRLDGGEPPFELVDELYRNGVLDNLETFGPNGEILMCLAHGLKVEMENNTIVWRG